MAPSRHLGCGGRVNAGVYYPCLRFQAGGLLFSSSLIRTVFCAGSGPCGAGPLVGWRFFAGGVGLVVRFAGVVVSQQLEVCFCSFVGGALWRRLWAGAIPICAGCGLLCLYGYELGAARGPWGYGARCVE